MNAGTGGCPRARQSARSGEPGSTRHSESTAASSASALVAAAASKGEAPITETSNLTDTSATRVRAPVAIGAAGSWRSRG